MSRGNSLFLELEQRFLAKTGKDEDGFGLNIQPEEDVFDFIPDHIRFFDVDLQIFCSLKRHPRIWLAALTVFLVTRSRRGDVMGTVVKAVKMGVMFSKCGFEFKVNIVEVFLDNKPSPYARLISDNYR